MKRNNKSGVVLIYNCTGSEFSKLNQIFAMLGLRMRRIQPNQYGQPLRELFKGEGEPAEVAAEPFAENMLIFCGLHQVFLNQLLEVIRLAKLPPIPLKAVLTLENQEWDSVKMREELLKEKEKIEAAKTKMLEEIEKAKTVAEEGAAEEIKTAEETKEAEEK